MTDHEAQAPDWAAIREAYEGRELKVTEIARTYGVSPPTIYRRIEDQEWQRRHAGRSDVKRRTLLRRLGNLVSSELSVLEESAQAGPQDRSLADRERLAKVAAGLVKLMESIAALEAELERARLAARKSRERPDQDDDTRRQSLAERIHRLCEERLAAGGPAETGK